MTNGVKQHTHTLGLQSLSCDVVVILSWLITWLQEVVNKSFCTCHALAEHLASASNSGLQNKPINRPAVTMWSLWTCGEICGFTQWSLNSCVVMLKGLQLHWLISLFDIEWHNNDFLNGFDLNPFWICNFYFILSGCPPMWKWKKF